MERMGRGLITLFVLLVCMSSVFAYSFEYGFERVHESSRYSEHESASGGRYIGARSNYARSRSFSYDRDYEREYGVERGYDSYFRPYGYGYDSFSPRYYRDYARPIRSCSSSYYKYRPFGC